MEPDSNTRTGGSTLRSTSARDLGIGIDLDKAAGELVAFADADQPRVVLRAGMAKRQQLLQHDGDLHAVGRSQRIQLQRLLAHRQCLVMGGTGDRAVDVAKVPPEGAGCHTAGGT